MVAAPVNVTRSDTVRRHLVLLRSCLMMPSVRCVARCVDDLVVGTQEAEIVVVFQRVEIVMVGMRVGMEVVKAIVINEARGCLMQIRRRCAGRPYR